MPFEGSFVEKPPFASGARVARDGSVRNHVRFEAVSLSEAPAASGALERCLGHVRALVGSAVGFPRKGFAAVLAAVGLCWMTRLHMCRVKEFTGCVAKMKCGGPTDKLPETLFVSAKGLFEQILGDASAALLFSHTLALC